MELDWHGLRRVAAALRLEDAHVAMLMGPRAQASCPLIGPGRSQPTFSVSRSVQPWRNGKNPLPRLKSLASSSGTSVVTRPRRKAFTIVTVRSRPSVVHESRSDARDVTTVTTDTDNAPKPRQARTLNKEES